MMLLSLTFLRLSERHQAMLDDLHVLMLRILRVITDMKSEFLEYQAATDDEFPVYFDEDDKLMRTDHIWH